MDSFAKHIRINRRVVDDDQNLIWFYQRGNRWLVEFGQNGNTRMIQKWYNDITQLLEDYPNEP